MIYETADKNERPSYRYRRNWREGKAKKRDKNLRGFGVVEKMFYYNKKIRDALEEYHAEQGYYQSGHKEGGGSSNHAFVSDPTYQQAVKHIAPAGSVIINADHMDEEVIKQPEKWLLVVEQTLLYFGNEKYVTEVLERRFFKNENIHTTCCALEISESRYYRLRDIGIMYARECAIQLGLIKVFDYKKTDTESK